MPPETDRSATSTDREDPERERERHEDIERIRGEDRLSYHTPHTALCMPHSVSNVKKCQRDNVNNMSVNNIHVEIVDVKNKNVKNVNVKSARERMPN